MNISILMNVINVAGNAIFVFVFKWSVAGVALSTALKPCCGRRCNVGACMRTDQSDKDSAYQRFYSRLEIYKAKY